MMLAMDRAHTEKNLSTASLEYERAEEEEVCMTHQNTFQNVQFVQSYKFRTNCEETNKFKIHQSFHSITK